MTDPARLAITELLNHHRFGPGVTRIHKVPAREASYAAPPGGVHPAVARALAACGVERLYAHQAEAIEHVLGGRHTVVVTPTASGKTLCYNVPALSWIASDPNARALYLFPTKALSRDQTAELNRLSDTLSADAELAALGLGAYVFDGDTPADQRRSIRTRAHIVVTNPDMLHTAILPHHPRWQSFLANLKLVVVDELHTYRGLFGSHVANVFRRLARLCRFYGSSPTFVCASATIANPDELARTIIGQPEVEVVSRSGAPASERWLVFYNPPVEDAEQRTRQSAVGAANHVMRHLLRNDVPTIAFARSRTSVEVLLKAVRDGLRDDRHLTRRVAGYRGGYLPQLRRDIERGLREGDLLGVISTNALELGIDIGSLQACVMAGYPGTIASTWQQAGRAGRQNPAALALAILIANNQPVDQFIINNPDFLLHASPEHARIDPDTLRVLVEHLKCAAFELPFSDADAFGTLPRAHTQEILGFLGEEAGLLRLAGGAWHWATDAYPANTVSLRSIPEENFLVIDVTRAPPTRYGKPTQQTVIAEVDFESAHTSLHKDAIYQLDAAQYIVEQLDYDNRKAFVRRSHDDYYTLAIDYTWLHVLDEFERDPRPPLLAAFGEIRVTRRFVGFKKIKFRTQENLGYGDIRLPDLEKHTEAAWLTLPSSWLDDAAATFTAAQPDAAPVGQPELLGALTGLSRALHTVACVALMCDTRDLGRALGSRDARWWAQEGAGGPALYDAAARRVVPLGDRLATTDDDHDAREALDPGGSAPLNPVLHDPTLFLYDHFPGGVGLAEGLYLQRLALLRNAAQLINNCSCVHGCPACVGPDAIVGPRGKALALHLLRAAAPP